MRRLRQARRLWWRTFDAVWPVLLDIGPAPFALLLALLMVVTAR